LDGDLVGGPAIGVLAVCQRRISMPHARFHLCEPEAAFSGDARTVEHWLSHRRRQWGQYCERIAGAIGRPVEEIESMLADGPYPGADEAVAMRLVQDIARPQGKITALRRPAGYANDT
jgi:ATP-dependent protease ClpP protease subunit